MANLMTDSAVNHDGSAAPRTASGSILVTVSGTAPATGQPVKVHVYSRSDSADYIETTLPVGFGRHRVNLAAGDSYYLVTEFVDTGYSVDLAVVDE